MWGWGAAGAHLHAAAGGTAAGALGRRGAGEGPVQLPTKALWTLHGPDSNAACGDAVQRRRRDTRLRAASNDVRADSNMALDWVLA